MIKRKMIHALGAFAVVSSIGGCSIVSIPLPPVDESTFNAGINKVGNRAMFEQELVATDLVNAMVQVEGLKPGRVRLYVDTSANSFDVHLSKALDAAGYHQLASSDMQAMPVKSTIKNKQNAESGVSSGIGRTYFVEIGDVKFKRDYRFENDRVIPESPMYVKGADSSGISSNDSLFATSYHQSWSPQSTPNATGMLSSEKGYAQGKQETVQKVAQNSVSRPTALRVQTVTGSDGYQAGDSFKVSVVSDQDAHIYCYYQDGLGKIALVFPNRYQPANAIRAGRTITLPESDNWQLIATRSGSPERFLCMAVEPGLSEQQLQLLRLPDLQPLPVDSLQQISQLYRSVAGTDIALGGTDISVH